MPGLSRATPPRGSPNRTREAVRPRRRSRAPYGVGRRQVELGSRASVVVDDGKSLHDAVTHIVLAAAPDFRAIAQFVDCLEHLDSESVGGEQATLSIP